VKLPPWEYLFIRFDSFNFHDLFYPTWIAAVVLTVVLVILYNIRTRQLRHHKPYLDLYEWLLWTGVITFTLVWIMAVFVFYFVFVIVTLAIGLGTLVWIRFVKFPPVLDSYEAKLAKQRYFSRSKFARPESTIRPKAARRARRRR